MHRPHRFNVIPPPLNNGVACPCLAFHPVTGIGSTLSAPRLAMLFRVICFRGEGCKLSLDQLWLIAPRAYRSENMAYIRERSMAFIHCKLPRCSPLGPPHRPRRQPAPQRCILPSGCTYMLGSARMDGSHTELEQQLVSQPACSRSAGSILTSLVVWVASTRCGEPSRAFRKGSTGFRRMIARSRVGAGMNAFNDDS